ncbi:unnamed protein product, partial [marine sediment metagenome]
CVITATATVNGKPMVFKDVIPQAVAADEVYDAGTADAESTALALIVEKLIEQGLTPEDINLEEIQASDNFTTVVEQVFSVLEENGNVTTDPDVAEVVNNTGEEIINPSPPNTEKKITSYKFLASHNNALSADVIGTIDSGSYTVSLTVPSGTDVTALIATFNLSPGASAKVGVTLQESEVTSNDFTSSVVYTVTAEDDSTQEWTVTVTVPNTDATLTNLTVSAGDLDPGFSSGTISYAVTVANSISTTTVTPTAADGTATIKVNGETVVSGEAFGPISLSVGANSISIVVTAE